MHSDTRAISGALKLRLRNLSTGLATGDVIDPGSGSTLQVRRKGSGAAKAGGNVEFKPVKGFVRGGEGGMVLTDQEKVVKGGCMYVVPQRRLGTSPFFQMGGSSLVVRGLGLLGPRVSLGSKRVGRTGWAERKKTRYMYSVQGKCKRLCYETGNPQSENRGAPLPSAVVANQAPSQRINRHI